MGKPVKFIKCELENVPKTARKVDVYLDEESLYFVLLDEEQEQNPFLQNSWPKAIDFIYKI